MHRLDYHGEQPRRPKGKPPDAPAGLLTWLAWGVAVLVLGLLVIFTLAFAGAVPIGDMVVDFVWAISRPY